MESTVQCSQDVQNDMVVGERLVAHASLGKRTVTTSYCYWDLPLPKVGENFLPIHHDPSDYEQIESLEGLNTTQTIFPTCGFAAVEHLVATGGWKTEHSISGRCVGHQTSLWFIGTIFQRIARTAVRQ